MAFSLKLVGGSGTVQGKGVRHGRLKRLDGRPAGAVHGNKTFRINLFHLRDGIPDNGFKNWSREVEAADHTQDLLDSRQLSRIQHGVDNPGMGASRDDHNPLVSNLDRQGLVIEDIVKDKGIIFPDIGIALNVV